MEIFGMGFGEILLIALVALIVLGPERLPEAARSVGKGIAEVRRAVEPARSVWRDISTELNNVATTTTTTFNTPPGRRNGNPEQIHPVLEMMTEEEKAEFVAGGDMPPRIAEHLAAQTAAAEVGSNGSREAVELPHINYAMPHAETPYSPEPDTGDDLYYPSPGGEDEGRAYQPDGEI
ncbi:MAG: Sec-independent protein translocase protein TatB [Chloroflexota bacterium]|nr:Sec-independent protein translocase protein TatB [Chloroflexota bacterium]MDQ5864188.1 Sec-independent protein translocase protein TatB [Chloroflexota bacterium]